jgi:hypothetical protein
MTVFINNVSQNDKATYFLLFKVLNEKTAAKHYVGLLGQPFRGTIHHHMVGDNMRTTFLNPQTKKMDLGLPFVEDAETGEMKELKVAPQLGKTQCFLWNFPDMEQWGSLAYEDSTELSFSQKKIKAALNFPGSKIEALLDAVPDAEPEDTEVHAAEWELDV